MYPLRISPRLKVPCAGPLCNKVLVGEGCPAASKDGKHAKILVRVVEDKSGVAAAARLLPHTTDYASQ